MTSVSDFRKPFAFFSHFARAPRKPRHPLARVALGVLGLGLLAVLVFFSLFVGAAMVAAGLVVRLLRTRKPTARTRVIEGEFRAVRSRALPSA
jgi:hypothetical protein